MVILGLDIASTTGFAWYDATPGVSLSSIKTGIIKAEGKGILKAASFAQQLIALVKNNKPDFVAIEAPFSFMKEHEVVSDDLIDGEVAGTTINPNSSNPKALAWTAVGLLAGGYNIPFVMIEPSSWRKTYFGRGFKPPQKWEPDKRHPQGGKWKNDWKKAAVDRCRALRIEVRNSDAAEAVGIAFAAAGHPQFKMMERGRAA